MSSSINVKKESPLHLEIDLNISDFVLTPLSCSSLLGEIIKNLLYQKSQIPYSYAWLKSIVSKKRKNIDENGDVVKINNFKIRKYYKTVSSVYDTLENILTSFNNEFINNFNLREIIVLFGPTYLCPKEVFSVRIPSLACGHYERNHVENNKKQMKLLRNIFLSETWMRSLDNSLSCTNTYIFLKKTIFTKEDYGDSTKNDSLFIPVEPLILPPRVKYTLIDLQYSEDHMYSCCNNLRIYQDSCNNDNSKNGSSIGLNVSNNSCDEVWYQCKSIIQGFKDCFINKVPASELW